MRKKLRDQGGITLVEMLCATIILVLLGLLLNTGLNLAVKSYREIVAESETQLLLSTAVDALADDLRYARDVETEADGSLKSYLSDSYGPGASFALGTEEGNKGQLLAGGKRMLPPGAYGKGAYQLQGLAITYDQNKQLFTVKLEVTAPGVPGVGAKTPEEGVTIRCLNPPAAPATPDEGGETP